MAKNPTEAFTSVRQTKSGTQALVMETHLSLGDADKSAMEYVGYSRFVLTIIDKAEGKALYPKANIPQADVDGIFHKKNAVVQARTLYEMLAFGATGNSSASEDPVIPFGNNKGKTVSVAAAEMTEADIAGQLAFFKKNLQKYPANIVLCEAFERELARKKEQVEAPPNAPAPVAPVITLKPVILYEQKVKFLRSNADEHGNVFVYSIVMEYNPAMRYPYEVRVENGYAPITETTTGGFNVEVSKMVNKTSASFRMAAEEFESMVDKMHQLSCNFNASMFTTQYRAAKKQAAIAAGVKSEQFARAESKYVPAEVLEGEQLMAEVNCLAQEILQSINK